MSSPRQIPSADIANGAASTERRTMFGFEEVPLKQKTERVHSIFTKVAARYDIMNDLMSGGLHRLWKDDMVGRLAPMPGRSYIDVAGGTGDVAFRIHDKLRHRAAWHDFEGTDPIPGSITICDINASMLAQGRDRAIDQLRTQGHTARLRWLCSPAEALPLDDACMDGYTIAFGIRNVADIPAALNEAHRILKPGSRFLCLEFCPEVLPWLQKAYDRYSFKVIPRLGELITGDRDSYQYLVESIRTFPPPEEFASMMRDAGFGRVTHTPMSLGIVAIHSGWKL